MSGAAGLLETVECLPVTLQFIQHATFADVGFRQRCVESENLFVTGERSLELVRVFECGGPTQQCVSAGMREQRKFAWPVRSQQSAHVERERQQAGTQYRTDQQREPTQRRDFLARVVDGAEIGLFLRLDLLDSLDGEIDETGFIVAEADGLVGLRKRSRRANQEACANTSTAIARRRHEEFPERGE